MLQHSFHKCNGAVSGCCTTLLINEMWQVRVRYCGLKRSVRHHDFGEGPVVPACKPCNRGVARRVWKFQWHGYASHGHAPITPRVGLYGLCKGVTFQCHVTSCRSLCLCKGVAFQCHVTSRGCYIYGMYIDANQVWGAVHTRGNVLPHQLCSFSRKFAPLHVRHGGASWGGHRVKIRDGKIIKPK